MSKRPGSDDFDQLIPELRKWNGGQGVDAESWTGMVGKYDLFVGYSLIFWPRFVEFEGYVLREGFSEDSLRGFEAATGGNRTAIEAVMNHVHIADIHHHDTVTEAQVRYLGRTLKTIYELKLGADFPQRSFVVDFNDEPGCDLVDYELTFLQA
jgi:hypothetical protein